MKKTKMVVYCFIAFFLSNLNAKVTFSDLKGKWFWQEGNIELIFLSENQLSLAGESTGYTLGPSFIRVASLDLGIIDYPFELQNNVLTISFPEGYDLPFVKAGSSAYQNNQQNNVLPEYNNENEQDQPNQQNTQQFKQSQDSGQNYLLQGKLCSWSGSSSYSSSYSSTKWAYFDGKGNFQYGSESSFSSDAGNAWGNNGAERGTYRVSGNTVYLTYPDGSSDTANVHMRQNDGSISELKYGDDVYGKALCE